MNKTFKKILSVCCTVVTTLTATLFRSTEVRAKNLYSIVFIGDGKVGKTQLVTRTINNAFAENYKPSYVVDFITRQTESGDELQLWDTAERKENRADIQTSYHFAQVLLYCCSCDQIESQSQQDLKKSFEIPDDSPVMLCITKKDDLHHSNQPSTNDFNQEKLQNILAQFREANKGCNILPKILVTSAKNNNYKLCTPEGYDSTECKDIYQNLAEDLVNLCRVQEIAQNPVDSELEAGMCETSGNDRAYWLVVPASLVCLGLIGGLGCYAYDRYKKKKAVNHPKGKYIQNEKKRITKTIKC